MPQIKIDYIVSFSSEHPDHPANNLLSRDITNKRWMGLEKGQSSNSIVVQLEKSVQITSIHIGNYHSALVEVLVGRSEASSQPYEVLLCASTFMNPSDSRNSVNITNVRTFKSEQLAASVQAKKWDRVRIVCSQPYNRHVQYGLSFIHFFSSDTVISSNVDILSQSSSRSKMLGKFKMRNDSDDEDSNVLFKPGELFAKLTQNSTLSTDAQIRQAVTSKNLNSAPNLFVKASRPVNNNSSKTNSSPKLLSRKRDKILYTDDDDEHHDKIDQVIKKDRDEKAKLLEIKSINEKKEKTAASNAAKDTSLSSKFNVLDKDEKKNQNEVSTKKDIQIKPKDNKNSSMNKTSSAVGASSSAIGKRTDQLNTPASFSTNNNGTKRSSTDVGPSTSKKFHPNKNDKPKGSNIVRGPDCLRGVVFVISGYVNPKRGVLRDTAIALGGRYCPDWNQTCTHLICAFPNTPKYDQVKKSGGNSVIVNGQWIEECGKEKAHLPWKWFATDPKQRIARTPIDDLPTPSTSGSTNQGSNGLTNLEDEDTDDEIERIIRKQESESKEEEIKKRAKKMQKTNDSDTTDFDTEEFENSLPKSDHQSEEITMKKSKKFQLFDDSETIQSQKSKAVVNKVKPQISDDSDLTDVDMDEIDRIMQKHEKLEDSKASIPSIPSTSTKSIDVFEAETESDDENRKIKVEKFSDESFLDELLPDFFSGIKFYIDPNINKEEYDDYLVKKYISAFDGDIVTIWPDEKIDVAITTTNFVHKLKPEKGKKCQFLSPEWIWKCNDTKTLYSFDEYEIR